MKTIRLALAFACAAACGAPAKDYPVVDTGQTVCYDARRECEAPKRGQPFHGQDAQYNGPKPAYRKNADGTVTDLVTGLTWVSGGDKKLTWAQAVAGASACRAGGRTDWRLPTIKELYSLILFSGTDPDPRGGAAGATPFIDTRHFPFRYGRAEDGERVIDAQYASATLCVDPVMHGMKAMFGVNFADGRIKGYPADDRGPRAKTYLVLYVRGNPAYGKNDFRDNGNGTVTDRATGLMWQKSDSGKGMDWQAALAYAEGLTLAGHTDWRLPNAKELQSLVDYSRSPGTTASAAISPLFACTPITNEVGQKDFPFYWTGTTHGGTGGRGGAAVYVAFGRAIGYMRGGWLDVHGAGAQRSDPKAGDPSDYPQGRGPQGDAVRILNHVRCVRSAAD